MAEPFARLLIERGADPFAPQALYNTSLGADSTFWLDLLWSESAKRGETHKWTGPAPGALGGANIPNALSYLLGNAVPRNRERTRWLLEHGADARRSKIPWARRRHRSRAAAGSMTPRSSWRMRRSADRSGRGPDSDDQGPTRVAAVAAQFGRRRFSRCAADRESPPSTPAASSRLERRRRD